MQERFPTTELLIQNRYGTVYKPGAFLLSTAGDFLALHAAITDRGLQLRFALDVPQLLSAHGISIGQFTPANIAATLRPMKPVMAAVASIHL